MKHNKLIVFALSALMLASCGGNSQDSKATSLSTEESKTTGLSTEESRATGLSSESSKTTSLSSDDSSATDLSSDDSSAAGVVTVASIEVDATLAQTTYLLSKGQERFADVVDPTGLVITAHMSDGTEEIIDVEDATFEADLKTKGEHDVTVTYGGASTTYKVIVGEYAFTSADIAVVDDEVILTVSGTYEGVSDLEFYAFDWSGDLQKNGYNGGGWDGSWETIGDYDYDELTVNENGTFSYAVTVTDLDKYLYIGHFGHKMVPNSQGGMQNMDLKITADENVTKTVTLGGLSYTMDYNLGADADPARCYGCLGLKIDDMAVKSWAVSTVTFEEVEGRVYATLVIPFANYTEAEFRALSWKFDFQINDNIAGGGWDRLLKDSGEAMANKFVIENNVATYTVDVTDLRTLGYLIHFGVTTGNDAPDYKPATFTNSEFMSSKKWKYEAVCTPGATDGGHDWGNIGIRVTDVSVPAATVSAINLVPGNGSLKLAIDLKYVNLASNADFASYLYADLMQFDTWAKAVDAEAVSVVAEPDDGEGVLTGNLHVSLEISGLLNASKEYFMHFAFGEGYHAAKKEVNFKWDDQIMTAQTVADPAGGTVTLKKRAVGDWSDGLVALAYTPAEN